MSHYEVEIVRTSEEYQKELARKAEYEEKLLCPECGERGEPSSHPMSCSLMPMPNTYECKCGCVWRICPIVVPVEIPEEPTPLECSIKNGFFNDIENPLRKIWFKKDK